jgi:uncharacterized membrane protein YeaQ/YmgE (transglycosylase-associated protein family)
MSIVIWLLFGLVVGLVAKLLTPGREPKGFMLTAALGMVGSLIGGMLGRWFGMYPSTSSTGGFFMSVLGAVLLLAIYHALQRPTITR